LTIERAGNVQDLTVKRGEVPIETVHSELLDNSSIGYIQVTNFSEPTYKEVVTAIKDLRKEGANRFILDVRGNPGGLLPSVLQIANIFLNDGDTIVKVQEKGEDPEVIKASSEDYGNFRVDEPVSLLVDEGSASASEILAGALKESANIPVIGTQTFGKGTVQSVLPVDKESELKLTIARWLTPDGHWINEKGVQPTEKVELPDYAHLSLIDTTKTYREGDQSESIENIAHILNALDYLDDEFVTDQFSSQMTQAVKEFQAESNLDSNGEVDAETGTELVRQVQVKIKNNDTQLDRAKKLMEKE
ncbi:MAG: S41 family peptidase, partial [Aerococcus suis]|nr:S41 family peptidase [Aerococcus suis]